MALFEDLRAPADLLQAWSSRPITFSLQPNETIHDRLNEAFVEGAKYGYALRSLETDPEPAVSDDDLALAAVNKMLADPAFVAGGRIIAQRLGFSLEEGE